MAKEVVKKEKGELSPEMIALMEEDAGAGLEEATSKDRVMPFISILQQQSPQVNKRDSSYVTGAEPGMFYNNASQKVYDGEEGILVVPCFFRRRYTEWKPRSAGGGLVRDYDTDDSCLKNCTVDPNTFRNMTPEGNEIVTSGNHYCILVEETQISRVLFSMAGTQLKKSRKWNSVLDEVRLPNGKVAPTFGSVFRFTTVAEQNDKGNWFGYKISLFGKTLEQPGGQEIYIAAREFKKLIQSGAVKVAEQPNPGPDLDIPM